jgi:hypothetical protein
MSGVDEASKKPVACSDYNPIFERLFGDVEDGSANVEGLVAYGLYKISKREWVTGLRKKEARGPSAEELRAYMATWTPSQLDYVRQSAEQTLASYAKDVLAEEEPRILRQALRGSFWRAVWPAMVAAALYTLALVALAIILARSGIDLIGILRRAAGKSLEGAPTEADALRLRLSPRLPSASAVSEP